MAHVDDEEEVNDLEIIKGYLCFCPVTTGGGGGGHGANKSSPMSY
jgi:hypothetical protein